MPAPRSMDREKPREPRIRVLPETGGGGWGVGRKQTRSGGQTPVRERISGQQGRLVPPGQREQHPVGRV